MVRHKRRWLFVRVQFKRDILVAGDENQSSRTLGAGASAAADDIDLLFPSKKELSRLIRDTMIECFGVAASGSVNDIQVQFCDAATRMALIRIPRELYGQTRATLTLCTKTTSSSSSSNSKGVPIILLDVFAVHGSTRTAKIAALREIQATYRPWVLRAAGAAGGAAQSRKEMERLCLELEGLLSLIRALE